MLFNSANFHNFDLLLSSLQHSTPAWPYQGVDHLHVELLWFLSANIDSHLWLSLAVEILLFYTQDGLKQKFRERCRKKHKVIKIQVPEFWYQKSPEKSYFSLRVLWLFFLVVFTAWSLGWVRPLNILLLREMF